MAKITISSKGKKWILAALVLVLVAGGCGVWYYLGHNSSDPVYVYPFQYIGMTEYWGDSQESYGPVTTDKIQTVFLTDTQTVTEILVKQGDQVKKGDLLMTFDTTLSDLALERARLEVEKAKLQLEDAKDQLKRIKNMKPMVIPEDNGADAEGDEDLGIALSGAYRLSVQKSYDGSTADKALICWLNSATAIDDGLLEQIRKTAEEFQNHNAKKQASSASADLGEDSWSNVGDQIAQEGKDSLETEPPETEPEREPENYEPFTVKTFHVVFKITQKNMSLGGKTLWQGMKVTWDGGSDFSFRLEDPTISDHMLADMHKDEETDAPEIDYGSGYTAAQLAQMRAEQEKKIKDLEFQVKMKDADYRIKEREVSDGHVYAQIDGEAISVLTEEEAKQTQQPVLKVSGGGGFFVEGSVSELEKDQMKIGQEVTVNDWNTGMVYTGTVESVGDFPSSNSFWNGMSNPNASFYPFMVYVDGSADLREGTYASIMYSAAESEQGIYLENPFIRTENGSSYVLVLGENGRLEKRTVRTGKALWGSYTQILDGITAEDLIAFPYGKNVKAGVPAVEGDLSNLYG